MRQYPRSARRLKSRLVFQFKHKGNGVNRFILAVALIAGPAHAGTMQFVAPSQAQAFAALGASCGGIKIDTYVTGFEAGGVGGEVHLSTTCSTGGRGSRPRTYQAWVSISWDLNCQIINFPLPYDALSPDPAFTETQGSDTISDIWTTMQAGRTSGYWNVYRAVLVRP
jgi:hypothetical protein